MILNTDPKLYQQVFGTCLEQNLLSVITPSQDRSTRPVDNPSTDKIVLALIKAAEATFKIDLAQQPLSDEEWQYIASDFSL